MRSAILVPAMPVQKKLCGSTSIVTRTLPGLGTEATQVMSAGCSATPFAARTSSRRRWRPRMRAIGAGAGPNSSAPACVSGAEPRTWEVARAHARASAPAPIARIRGRHRLRLLVRAAKGVALQPALRSWVSSVPCPGSVRVMIDVDPQSFF